MRVRSRVTIMLLGLTWQGRILIRKQVSRFGMSRDIPTLDTNDSSVQLLSTAMVEAMTLHRALRQGQVRDPV